MVCTHIVSLCLEKKKEHVECKRAVGPGFLLELYENLDVGKPEFVYIL